MIIRLIVPFDNSFVFLNKKDETLLFESSIILKVRFITIETHSIRLK